MISGDTAQTPDQGHTSGSQSIEYGGTAIRLACAEARALLVDHAAERLGLSAEALKVSEGVIAAPDGRKLGYGELAAGLELRREITAKVAPKPLKELTIVGRSVPRRDIPAKVPGGAAYVQDTRLPEMVHGRVVRPPRYGARLDTVDDAAARAVPGVIAVVPFSPERVQVHSVKDRCPGGLPGVFCAREQTREQGGSDEDRGWLLVR